MGIRGQRLDFRVIGGPCRHKVCVHVSSFVTPPLIHTDIASAPVVRVVTSAADRDTVVALTIMARLASTNSPLNQKANCIPKVFDAQVTVMIVPKQYTFLNWHPLTISSNFFEG